MSVFDKYVLSLLFANLGHVGSHDATVRGRRDGGKPSGSNKIASLLPVVSLSFAYSRGPGRAPGQRKLWLRRERARAVLGVIAGNFASCHRRDDTERAPS